MEAIVIIADADNEKVSFHCDSLGQAQAKAMPSSGLVGLTWRSIEQICCSLNGRLICDKE